MSKLKSKKLEEHNNMCPNCGSNFNLQLSHFVPVGQNKSLELHPKNSTIDCNECHDIWQHGKVNGMIHENAWHLRRLRIKNFKERILAIKELDESYYNRILIKMPDWQQAIIEKY